MSTLPPEGAYSDVELSWIDSEPPNLFPQNQDSYWGQWRRILTDFVQAQINFLELCYVNQSPVTATEMDMPEWEYEAGLAPNPSGKTLEQRRSEVLGRFHYGYFTRTKRRSIVESFIIATFGTPIRFVPGGVPFGPIPFFAEPADVATLYNIVEHITSFTYTVYIKNTVTPDTVALTRELRRLTPAGIDFDIQYVPDPFAP